MRAFEKAFPDRLFDVGIAEEHAVSFAAGLALGGDDTGRSDLFFFLTEGSRPDAS